jgi:hypothetical protein
MVSKNKQSGGCTDRQKGIAAQIRTFTNSELREELNKIVHSGDSVSAKTHHPSNEYIDLSNNFDSKAEDVINRGIDFIKNSHNIKYKQQNKILNGIVQLHSKTNATTMYNKPTTTLSRVTPRKSFKDITSTKTRITPNASVKSRRSRRSRNRNRRSRSRKSRRSRS